MALVKCPECGKEISDKSNACIHCGFPLKNTDPKESINSIVHLFKGYAANSLSIGDVSNIFSDVMQEVYKIKQSHSEQEAADLIAKSIIDGLILIPSKISWMNGKQYCEIINYKALSADGMDYFTNQLYSVLSIQKFYDDGSGGYTYITPFFYATYMVLQYGSESNKAKLMSILKTSCCGSKQTWYDNVVSMFRQHGCGNSTQQISAVQNSIQSIGNIMGDLEERTEVSNETEILEIRRNQAETFIYKEMKNNREILFLLMPFLLFMALCFLYISWFNFWSVLIILFIVLCVGGSIGVLQENRKFKKYFGLIYTDISVLEEVERLIEIKKEQDAKQEEIKNIEKEKQARNYRLSHPKCPNCGSTNTKQISNVNRVASVAMWGLASSKIGKQYQCNQCNHKW